MTVFASACFPRFFFATVLGLGALAIASVASAQEFAYQPIEELTANEQVRKADAETQRYVDRGKRYEMNGFQITRRNDIEVGKIVEFPVHKIVEVPNAPGKQPSQGFGKRPVEVEKNFGQHERRHLQQAKPLPKLRRL